MVGARVVVQGVLDELETGEADSVEREMIGAAGVADGEGVHAEVVERDHPGGEEWGDHFVALKIDAANFARAVFNVVVSVRLGMLWSRLHDFRIGVMLLDVGAIAEQYMFLAGPRPDADGTEHLWARE